MKSVILNVLVRSLTIFVVLVLSLSWSSTAFAQQIVRGPYQQILTEDSIILRWRSDQATGSEVRYGTSLDNLSEFIVDPALVDDHEVGLSGLTPDTRYYYAVGAPGSVPSNGDIDDTFLTAPIAGTPVATRIWVLGDSGTANEDAEAVRDRYQEFADATYPADMLLMLGDNAYDDGTDSEHQDAVFDMYPNQLSRTVLWPTFGNHEEHTSNSSSQTGPYYEIFTLPKNAEAGGIASGTEAYYSFDYGNIHFINLNTADVDMDPGSAMLLWLEADLAANDKQWLIAYWHHPAYSKGSHDSDSSGTQTSARENFLPLLEDYGVDLVLSGHSHSYERSFLIDGHYGTSDTLDPSMILNGGDGREDGDGAYSKGAAAPHEGGVHVVAGSSGKVSEGNPLDHPAMFIGLEELGSMILDVAGDRLDAVFLNSNGAASDYFTISHGPDEFPPEINSVVAVMDDTVEVQFSEAVEQASAENLANYQIDQGITIAAAVLSGSNKVLLSTSSHTTDVIYTLTVNNVADLAGNVIPADSQASYTYSNIQTLDTRVASSSDDAEERNSTGEVKLSSSDLELISDGGNDQTVGMRFTGVSIPQGVTILSAYVQFTVDETNSGATSLTIRGEDSDDALTFSATGGNISSRSVTSASATWNPAAWNNVGAAGADQRTPDLRSVVQEIVDRPGWNSSNALAIIVSGGGERTAEAYDGDSSAAALLHVEYSLDGGGRKRFPVTHSSARPRF